MLLRTKSSVLGALGSFLTMILIYHILKLGTEEKVYNHYLDSTEITNYTLLESLLSVQLNEDKMQFTDSTPTKVIAATGNSHIHYSLEELKQLSSTASLYNNLNTTVLIRYLSENGLNNQLDSILRQSFSPNSILIACSRNETALINKLIQEKEEQFHLYDTIHTIETTSVTHYWFSGIDRTKLLSDYVVIMDTGVLPGTGYFDLTLRLLQTPVFEHAMIGTESPSCQQNNEKARYVKSLHGIWVLRREWYMSLIESNQQHLSLSQTLYEEAQIPSIQLPRLMDQRELLGNTNLENNGSESVVCEDKGEGSIMFYMDNQPSPAFEKLICEFGQKMEVIHIVGKAYSKLTVPTNCSFEERAVYIRHTTNDIKEDFNNLLNQLSPRVIIYEHNENTVDLQNELLLSRNPVSKMPTIIQLPRLQDTLIVSWMTNLSVEALEQWHIPSIKLMITTSGNKKSQQVKRLFHSIKNANYLNDRVDVAILMNEKTDGLTSKFVNNLQWTIGEKNIRHRISGAHPMQIFSEAWYPSSDHEYAVMLDDRIELSDRFYVWIKYNLLKYRYSGDSTTANNSLFGISLYSPRIIDTDPTGRQLLYPLQDGYPYLMQAPSSSGALYFPEHWREFHDYITARLTDQSTVKRGSGNRHLFKDSLLTISRSNRWINSWRKYFDEMIYMRGYVMLYPPSQSSFSTLYITDSNINKKKEAFTSAEKLYNVSLTQNQVKELPEYEQLSILDIHGKLTNQSSLIERGQALQRKFSACEPRPNHNHDPSDMLCPFSQLVEIPVIDSEKKIPVKNVNIYH